MEDKNLKYIKPIRLSPFYINVIRLPRKLKKKIKNYCGVGYKLLSNEQRLWCYLGDHNLKYRNYIIAQICK